MFFGWIDTWIVWWGPLVHRGTALCRDLCDVLLVFWVHHVRPVHSECHTSHSSGDLLLDYLGACVHCSLLGWAVLEGGVFRWNPSFPELVH